MTSTAVSEEFKAAVRKELKNYNLSPERFDTSLALAIEIAAKPHKPGWPPLPTQVALIALARLDNGYLDSDVSTWLDLRSSFVGLTPSEVEQQIRTEAPDTPAEFIRTISREALRSRVDGPSAEFISLLHSKAWRDWTASQV